MTIGIWLAIAIGGLQTLLLVTILLRSYLHPDPLGHGEQLRSHARLIGTLDKKVSDVVSDQKIATARQEDDRRAARELKDSIFERLDMLSEANTKLMAHMTGLESAMDQETKERRLLMERVDYNSAVVGNAVQNFGRIEAALQKVIDGRPGEQA